MTISNDEYMIRIATPEDMNSAYHICLKTGNDGNDGEPLYREDPDVLGRIFVGPYLIYEPEHGLILEDRKGICGYALAALDSKAFYSRYEAEWRQDLCTRFANPDGNREKWTPVQIVYSWYHNPDYTMPEPYDEYPSHLHIDLLDRAQGRGIGSRMIGMLMDILRNNGSSGVHLGVSKKNTHATHFYKKLGFRELLREVGEDGCIYMGKRFQI